VRGQGKWQSIEPLGCLASGLLAGCWGVLWRAALTWHCTLQPFLLTRYLFCALLFLQWGRSVDTTLACSPAAPDVCCCSFHVLCVSSMQGGRSVDTTMGLTPLEGLMMGTRCGERAGRAGHVGM